MRFHLAPLLIGAWSLLFAACLPTPILAQNYQKGEQILAADKAPADALLRRQDMDVWYQLSNLRKGGVGIGVGAEFSFDYVRTDPEKKEAGFQRVVTLVAKDAQGRKEYNSMALLHSKEKSGSMTAESIFSNLERKMGDNFEVWMETFVSFEGKSYRFKVSNSLTIGSVKAITLARHWTADETKLIERWKKNATHPGAVPANHVLVTSNTPVVAGMPCQAGWMAEWQRAEIIDVRTNGLLLIKYDPSISLDMVTQPRNWVAVDSKLLEEVRAGKHKLEPSVRVLPDGFFPIDENLTMVKSDVKLVPGTPVRVGMGPAWLPVTVIKVLPGEKVRFRWDKNYPVWKDDERPRNQLVIDKETLKELQTPEGIAKIVARSESIVSQSESSFEGKTGDAHRKKQENPITIRIPKNAVRVTEQMPIEEGTKLGCSWGNAWHDVTVLEVNDDGTLFIHWDRFGDTWDADSTRDQLIIDKKVLGKLTSKSKKEDPREKSDEPPKTARSTTTKEKPTTEKKSSGGKYQVTLKSPGQKKFAVINVVMQETGLEIKDAKELVESTPILLKQGLSQADAEKLLKKLTEAGGSAASEAAE